jgi:hypothetical protein
MIREAIIASAAVSESIFFVADNALVGRDAALPASLKNPFEEPLESTGSLIFLSKPMKLTQSVTTACFEARVGLNATETTPIYFVGECGVIGCGDAE